MLPPVDSTTLSANPRFETLYRDLCTNKLNPDGSSVLDAKVQKERDIFATVSVKDQSICSQGVIIRGRGPTALFLQRQHISDY